MAPRGLTGSPVAALEPLCSSSLVKYPRGGGPQGRGGRQPPAPVVGSGQRRILCQTKGLSAHRPTPFGMSLQLGWFGGCLRRHKTARSPIIRATAAQHLLHHADPSGVVVRFWAQIGRTFPEIGSGRFATGSPLAQDLARDMQPPRSGLLAAALRRLFVARGECVARGGRSWAPAAKSRGAAHPKSPGHRSPSFKAARLGGTARCASLCPLGHRDIRT